MSTEDVIKEKINALFKSNPIIHISVVYTKPRISVEKAEVKILGVWRHMFMVEECRNDKLLRHSIQYGEILSGSITIDELT